jgi:hypothetical protein
MKVHKSNRGQLSIFMGITLILVMSMMAFIINVGLFVKAKINLQNAVDAAAFSGAATQSRQLTNIAYANWELRNTYKEFLFKYYILGQIGLFPVQFQNIAGKGDVDFRLSVPPGLQFNNVSATQSVPLDAYNVPSICIHNNTSKNICPLYMVPGLPRFPAIGVAGITEIHEALVNKLVSEKASDCSSRSNINYLAAITWLYGSGIKDLPNAPILAANRPGAWPQALELAMRIRNLEMIMNRPPVTNGIGFTEARTLPNQATDLAMNERPYKAFMSAFRNLSGGKYKEGSGTSMPDEFSSQFKLYEIPPTVFPAQSSTPSGFLIPDSFSYPVAEGGKANQKYYVDLQVMPVNYAVFYSTFTSTKYKYEGVDAEASCGISKTAIPVPGYILGFTKNPEVLTYYAVRGESKFVGLFFPFPERTGIKLSAYAAAKPFGGRIGPKLFKFEGSSLKAREDKDRKSKPYISGLVAPPAGIAFKTGYPIPYDQSFWASNAKNNFVLGGIPGTSTVAATPSFGVPNMVYDFEDEADLSQQSSSTELIQDINYNVTNSPPAETLGLYKRVQFRALKNSLGNTPPGSVISTAQITDALIRSRRATRYDALNYLIPDATDIKASETNNTTPFIVPLPIVPGTNAIRYKLFAPLSGPNTLYPTNNAVETVVTEYLTTITPAMDTYLQSLLDVANSIYNTTTQGGSSKLLEESAKSIHINAGVTGANKRPAPLVDASCVNDIASKFHHFFTQNNTACGIVPIKSLMVDFIAKHSNPADGSSRYYFADYFLPGKVATDKMPPINLMTAYYPGKRQGATPDDLGKVGHPFDLDGNNYISRRNFYSTKFIQLAKVIDSPPNTKGSTTGITDYSATPALREVYDRAPDDLLGQTIMKNGIKFDATTGINNNYYLEF